MTEMVEVNGYLTPKHLYFDTHLWFLEKKNEERSVKAANIIRCLLNEKRIKKFFGWDFFDFDADCLKINDFIFVLFKDENGNKFNYKININNFFIIDELIEDMKKQQKGAK